MPLAKFVPNQQPHPALPDSIELQSADKSLSVPNEVLRGEVPSSQPKYIGRKLQTDDSDKMSKADWAAKDRRIGRAGLYQAALQSLGAVQFTAEPTLDAYLATVRRIAEEGLKFVCELDR